MKYMNHMWAIALALLVGMSTIFTGCQSSANPKKEVAMGRYLEEEIEFEGIDNERMSDIVFFENKEGNIEALIEEWKVEADYSYKCYVLGEDNVWRETDEALSSAIASKGLDSIYGIKKDKKTGELYFMGGNEKVDEAVSADQSFKDRYHFIPYFARIKEDGTLEEIVIEWETTNDLSSDLILGENQLFIYLHNVNVIQQYDLKTGRFVKEIGGNILNFTVLKDKIYAIPWGEQSVLECYDIKTGKLISTMETVVAGYYNDMIPEENEKGIYFINQEGIYYLAENEEMVEMVLDGKRYTISSPQCSINNVCMYKGIFYMGLRLDNTYTCRQYKYHEDIPLEPEKTLTVFSLQDCPSLKEAAQIYMGKNPDVYVDFNIINQSDEPMDRETKSQAVEAINTQILAGDVADIMVLDGLPAEAYIEKGILGDMSSILNEIEKNGNYYDNLMRAYENNNKIYGLPLKFSILSAVGERELLKDGFSIEDLAAYQRQYPDKQVLGNMAPEELVKMMSSLWYSKIIGSDGKVNNKQLITFLEAVNTLAPMKEGMTDCYSAQNCYLGARTFQAMDKEIKVIIEDITDINSLQVMMYAKEQLEQGMIAPCIEGEKNLINLQQLIGINEASDKKEEIQELLSIAFSKEISDNNFLWNFTVNKDIADSMFVGEYTQKVVGTSSEYDLKHMGASFAQVREDGEWEYKDILKWYTEEGKYYINVLKDAKALKPIDSKILDIIQQESEDYFMGDISVAEATENIKEKVELYLSEQNK